MQTSELLEPIEHMVHGGKAVVTADDATLIAMMQWAIASGKSATFYVPITQSRALTRLFWSPRRIKEIGMELVSSEERARIESELDVKDMGPWYSNNIQCGCGGMYGAYEFIKQGLAVHGRDWLGAVMALKNVGIVRINPAQDAFCPVCKAMLLRGHYYYMPGPNDTMDYGCCGGEIPITMMV
jgi:hypothetical protein